MREVEKKSRITVCALRHWTGFIILMGVLIMTASSNASVEYLSDNEEIILYVSQGWGQLGIDTCAHAQGQTPLPLQITDKRYAKGLGHHAPGEIVIELGGQYEAFEAEVGVQWQGGQTGSVVFQVYVDDEKRFDSGIMREQDPPKQVKVDVSGADELRLVATDAGDGITCDCANWADARLSPASESKGAPAREFMDIAPFGRVCSWDPNRTDGCRAGRIEEFLAEDLFLESDIESNDDGTYTVPTFEGGKGCIGHQWLERRRLSRLEISFTNHSAIPQPNKVRVEAWVGESLWQGNWKLLTGKITVRDRTFSFDIDRKANPERRTGYWKVRWILPPSSTPYIVTRPIALKPVSWQTTDCFLWLDPPRRGRVRIDVYNAQLTNPALGEWDTSSPTRLDVRYGRKRPGDADRAVIRFVFLEDGLSSNTGDKEGKISLPSDTSSGDREHCIGFGIAVDDLVTKKYIYVPEVGLLATTDPEMTPSKYKSRIAGLKTVLERVREMPDQTLEQAMAKTHNPIQDNGPTMLSLACDNRKFLVQQNGRILFYKPIQRGWCKEFPMQHDCSMTPSIGSSEVGRCGRYLEGGWMPILVTTFRNEGIEYRQKCFVAPVGSNIGSAPWFNDKALFVSAFRCENTDAKPSMASLRLDFLANVKEGIPAQPSIAGNNALVEAEGKILAFVKVESQSLSTQLEGHSLVISGVLEAGQSANIVVYIPAWEADEHEVSSLPHEQFLVEKTKKYWQDVLAPAMQIVLPDMFLTNVIRASQVHCLIAARCDDNGETVAPWIASMSYGPLESEANSIVRGMAFMGHLEFARRSLEFFIHRYNPAGFLTTGYTLMGTGWHLWSLGEYYALVRDKSWAGRIANDLKRVCDWIVRQRSKTKKTDCHARKLPEYGLMPPGVMADWNAFNYHFCLNGYYYAGLKHAAEVLADIGDKKSEDFFQEAEDFRREILRAYHWTQSLSPVVSLQNGTWVRAYPGRVHCPGPTGEFYPGEDGNRSWCYDVELGAHQLVPQGVIDPGSHDVASMMEHMEDVQFLSEGWFDYPADKNKADWFNLGGFAKVQPYYCRNVEVYALRDDVKPFIRSYFNALASLLNTENMSFWEHFHNAGAFNKTHETGYFLHQTRTMLLQERGNELWIAPFVTYSWLTDGKIIEVKNAPTVFGPVSYRIESQVSSGRILLAIEPPKRNPPGAIILRLRHPEAKPIKSVKVNGRDVRTFDASAGTITFSGLAMGTINAVVEY